MSNFVASQKLLGASGEWRSRHPAPSGHRFRMDLAELIAVSPIALA